MVKDISTGKDGKRDVSKLVAQLDRIEKGEHTGDAAGIDNHHPDTAVNLDEFQMTIVEQAEELGFAAYQIIVELSPESILKGARAYMVFESLEGKGELIKTHPVTEEIEDGNFEKAFELIFLTEESTANLKKNIMSVPEISDVRIQHVRFRSINDAPIQEDSAKDK